MGQKEQGTWGSASEGANILTILELQEMSFPKFKFLFGTFRLLRSIPPPLPYVEILFRPS